MEDEIATLIDAYIQSDDTLADMRVLAEAQNALPMYLDMGGCISLKSDGTFILHPWDTKEFNKEDNPAWQILALVHGSKKYPILTTLLPIRSSEALDCQACNGTGHQVIGINTKRPWQCGKCLGLGWVDSYIESLKL